MSEKHEFLIPAGAFMSEIMPYVNGEDILVVGCGNSDLSSLMHEAFTDARLVIFFMTVSPLHARRSSHPVCFHLPIKK